MSYNKTTWKNRLVENPRTYQLQQNADGTVTLIPKEGTVTEEGTPINAGNLNKIEQGIADNEAALDSHKSKKATNTTLGHVMVDGNTIVVDANGKISAKANATTADITYYVNDSTGLDTNTGLNSGSAFKTIMKAIDSLPQTINHTVIINVADGTYNEAVSIKGLVGKGSITLIGNVTTPANCIVNNVITSQNSLSLAIRGFNAISTSTNAFSISSTINFVIDKCVSTTDGKASSSSGIYVSSSLCTVMNCQFSNKAYGILVGECSTVHSSTNTGTANTVGLQAYSTSTIGKYSTQPAGTTAETTFSGGVIRA